MKSKIYRQLKEKAPKDKVSVKEAIDWIKQNARKTFDETVEVHVKLGVDPSKSDQMVRGSASLPGGAPKSKKIVVFSGSEDDQKASTKAGAVIAGGEELIKKIAKEGKLDADIAIATPDMMPKIAEVARILGPIGLMPNPKTGTVSPKPASVVKDLMGGKLSFKMDQLGNIHEAIAKVSWDEEKIEKNIISFIEAVSLSKPSGLKGQLISAVFVKSTMSPAIRVTT